MIPYTKPLLAIVTLAFTAVLPSCVDPYSSGPQYGGHSGGGSVYRTGYIVNDLPRGYRTEVIGGQRYYSHNGNYYRSSSGRYVIVDPPRHSSYPNRYPNPNYRAPGYLPPAVRTLPRGYHTVIRKGVTYYESRGVYYRATRGGYYIVPSPY